MLDTSTLNTKKGLARMSEGNPSPIEAPISLERLQEFSGGDLDFERELLQAFVIDIETRIHNLQAAIANQDATAVLHEAHQIKGASSNISAVEMQQLSARLEEDAKENALESAPEAIEELKKLLEAIRVFVETL